MSTTHICLLRGINVGGKNRIKMAELRQVLSEADLSHVTTYIQSGNILFQSKNSVTDLQKLITRAIREQFGLDVPAVVRTSRAFHRIIEQNPFRALDPSTLHVTLLADQPADKAKRLLDHSAFLPDQFQLVRDCVYMYCPNGMAKTKLNITYFERKLGTVATSRNWKTINRLVEMSNG